MKTYIPKQPKQVRERIEAKLDVRLVERLERYCQYLESDRDYVVAQALELIFRKDRGFSEWLAKQGALSPDKALAASPGVTSRRMRKEHPPTWTPEPAANRTTLTDPNASGFRVGG